MTALVSVEQLGIRLGLGDTIPDGVESQLLLVLDDTTLVLSELLRTEFDRVTDKEDTYSLNSRMDKPFVDQDPHLRTAQGFIDSSATFEVRTALTLQELPNGDPEDLSGVQVDYDKGRIILGSSNYIGVVDRKLYPQEWDGHYVRVKYTAGFTASSGVYANVPSWLQSIALTIAADVYRADKGCGKKGGCYQSCAEAAKKYWARISSKVRFMPSAYAPML